MGDGITIGVCVTPNQRVTIAFELAGGTGGSPLGRLCRRRASQKCCMRRIGKRSAAFCTQLAGLPRVNALRR
jgi:hypothetical protein